MPVITESDLIVPQPVLITGEDSCAVIAENQLVDRQRILCEIEREYNQQIMQMRYKNDIKKCDNLEIREERVVEAAQAA